MIGWDPAAAGYGAIGLGLFLLLLAVLHRLRRRRMRLLAEDAAWAVLLPDRSSGRIRARTALRIAALVFALAALARPRWGERWEEVERQGLDLVVAFDVSRSMWAEDFRPNRLQHAKWGLRDLLPHVQGDRLGLVIFAGDAQVLCPLTTDHDAFRMLLNDARPELIARGGTHIGRGLEAAIDTLGPPGEADRVIVLISDGENHEGDLQALTRRLRDLDIRVFAVGVGDPEGALIPLPAGSGASAFLRNRDNRVVQTRLDEQTLRSLSSATGGAYVRATPADFGLERLYLEAMSELRRAQQDARRIRYLRERFQLFLGAALLCLAAELALAGFFRGVRTRSAAARLAGLALLAFFTCVPDAAANPSGAAEARRRMAEGMRAYAREEWDAAAEAFDEAARLAGGTGLDPAHAHFNAALALSRARGWEAAAERFEEAARTTDRSVLARALYNRGRTLAEDAETRAESNEWTEAQERMKEALQMYEQAMRLDPADLDPKINHELARRRLAEIEEMTPPPPPESEPKPDQDPESDPDPNAEDKPEPQPEPDGAEPDAAPDAAPDEGEPDGEPGEAQPPGMTPGEAERILDALREEEAAQREGVRPHPSPPQVEKDW